MLSVLSLHYHLLATLGAAGIQVVVVGSDNIRTLVEKAKEYPVLKYVISIDPTVPEDVAAMAKEKNIELRTFDQVIVSIITINGIYAVFKIAYQELGLENTVEHQVCI